MKIKHIKKIGNNKYEIELEHEKIKTYDTIMLKYQIVLKKELSDELIKKIKQETKNAEIFNQTIQFMNRKQRSEKEVREYLQKQKIENIDEMIMILKQQNMFREDAYIESYIHDRFLFSNDGPIKIESDLIKKGFDPQKVKRMIEAIEENDVKLKLSKLIHKKTNHKYSEKYYKQKILDQMEQLGYPKDMIEELLDSIDINHSEILKMEARKLYQKYKNKKSSNELIMVLKQKLYQKQYPIDEINQVLEELQIENS